MKPGRNSGQITVFLSIILLAVILISGLLVDAARISAGEALVKKAVSGAARSILAGYGSRVKEDYGILALPAKNEEDIKAEAVKYISKNLMIGEYDEDKSKSLDLYGFRLEDVNIVPVYSLTENSVFKQQVLEYMKYRAPKEIVEGFVERLEVFSKAGKMSEAYKKKVGLDKILSGIDKSQQRLKKDVDGDGESVKSFINGFNANGSWMVTFNRYIGLMQEIRGLKNNLASLDGEIRRLQEVLAAEDGQSDSDENGDSTVSPISLLKNLYNTRSELLRNIGQLSGELNSNWYMIRDSMTSNYIEPNTNALEELDKIVEAGKRAEAVIKELDNFLVLNFKGDGDFTSEFAGILKEDTDKIKELLLNSQKAVSMMDSLKGNIEALYNLADNLDLLRNLELDSSTDPPSVEGLKDRIISILDSYDNVVYSYEKPEKGDKKDDPRKGRAEAVKEVLAVIYPDDRNYEKAGIRKEDLPSYSNNSRDGRGNGDQERLTQNADFFDEDSMFQENSLAFIGSIGNMVSDNLNALMDNIYINEYLMGTFKNAVPSLKLEGNVINDTGFKAVSKTDREGFYQCEIEYILHGNPSENANRLSTKAQVLFVRFGLNTLHVYTDARKKELAAGIAAAVAGWWTGGAGIPIISNLIICGWGMGEAILDLNDIMDGKPVPIYKSKGDWKLDIGLTATGAAGSDSQKTVEPRTDSRLYFTYYDYLRLFLMMTGENTKLSRAQDLIQINVGGSKPGFTVSGCNTCIRVEAEVSMKYLFLTRAFVPGSMKTADGRRKIKVLLYESY